MARFTLSAILLAAVAGVKFVKAYDVEFFYTETLDTCEMEGISIPANEQTEHGGVCAYVPSTKRIYACPAPDPTCWTWAQNCKRGDNAGPDQILCSAEGTSWCCAGDETCTTTENQINVCISNFTSPNSGVDVVTANKTELQALGISNVTATSQSVDPTPFSTLVVADSSSTPTTTSSSTTSQSPTPTNAASSATSSNSSLNVTADHTSSGLSGGAIAGIVIGVVGGLAIVGLLFFFLGRRRRRMNRANTNQDSNSHAAGLSAYQASSGKEGTAFQYGSEAGMNAGAYTNEKRHYVPPTSEMGDQSPVRAEMQAEVNGRFSHGPSAQTRHEMAG